MVKKCLCNSAVGKIFMPVANVLKISKYSKCVCVSFLLTFQKHKKSNCFKVTSWISRSMTAIGIRAAVQGKYLIYGF